MPLCALFGGPVSAIRPKRRETHGLQPRQAGAVLEGGWPADSPGQDEPVQGRSAAGFQVRVGPAQIALLCGHRWGLPRRWVAVRRGVP